jgi:hypothetical protein
LRPETQDVAKEPEHQEDKAAHLGRKGSADAGESGWPAYKD